MPIKENREYRTMERRARENREGEEKNYIVEGYATTFGDPYELFRDGKYVMREEVDKDAFKDTDMSDVIFQIDHEGRVYARTRNGSLGLDIDEHGLKTTTDLGLTESSRSVYEDISAGLYDRMSFGFTVNKDSYTEEEMENGDIIVTRTILGISKLYDVSAVSFPANPNTEISARSKDLFYGEIKRFEAERLREQKITECRKALKEQISRILEDESNG